MKSAPRHKNVVYLHRDIESVNNLYLFMELCDQGDLERFIRKRSGDRQILSEAEAQYVMRDIVSGLTHLNWQCRVMHRDIKLENILVKTKKESKNVDFKNRLISDFEFKLGDLGLAKNFSTRNEMKATMCGTPLYMAPEVIQGRPYTYKADIWSLGTLLFQILTGQLPFDGQDIAELKLNI